MKNVFILTSLFLAILLFSSCSEDNNVNPTTPKYTKLTMTSTEDSTDKIIIEFSDKITPIEKYNFLGNDYRANIIMLFPSESVLIQPMQLYYFLFSPKLGNITNYTYFNNGIEEGSIKSTYFDNGLLQKSTNYGNFAFDIKSVEYFYEDDRLAYFTVTFVDELDKVIESLLYNNNGFVYQLKAYKENQPDIFEVASVKQNSSNFLSEILSNEASEYPTKYIFEQNNQGLLSKWTYFSVNGNEVMRIYEFFYDQNNHLIRYNQNMDYYPEDSHYTEFKYDAEGYLSEIKADNGGRYLCKWE